MKSIVVAALFGIALATPQGSTSGSSPGCPANRSPYCCDIRDTPQTPSTGCRLTEGPPSDVYTFFSGCANLSLQATCCSSISSNGNGVNCQVYQP